MSVAAHDDRGLGTSVRVLATDDGLLGRAVTAVQRVVQDIDRACSRFRDDSEISQLHRTAGHRVLVSPLLMRALQAAIRGAELSGGAVDPTVGAAMRANGYDADIAVVRARLQHGTPRQRVAAGCWRGIHLDTVTGSALLERGIELDLGSTAKALAADMAASAAHAAMRAGGVLVSLGGDIAVAGTAPGGGWQVQLDDDSASTVQKGAETVALHSGGLATSSITTRRWVHNGRRQHHIVDPRTALSVEGPWRTVSVAAGSCLDANIAATAAIVMGAHAPAWLQLQRVPSRLVRLDGAVVRTDGWPEPAVIAPGGALQPA